MGNPLRWANPWVLQQGGIETELFIVQSQVTQRLVTGGPQTLRNAVTSGMSQFGSTGWVSGLGPLPPPGGGPHNNSDATEAEGQGGQREAPNATGTLGGVMNSRTGR